MHGDGDVGLGSGGELLVSSLLIKRYGFDARSALAWVRVTHPPAKPQVLSFALVPSDTPAKAVLSPIECGGKRWSVARRYSAPAVLASPELEALARRTCAPVGEDCFLIVRCKSVPEDGGDLCGLRAVPEPDVFDALLALNNVA